MEQGTIIFLNGTSSAGKSSIAKVLQDIMDGYFIHTGIDHFIERLPRKYFDSHEVIDAPPAVGELWVVEKESGRLIEIRVGPVGYKVLAGIYYAFAGLAKSGNDVIVDDVIFDPLVLKSAVSALHTYNVLFVGVRCPREVAEQRERDRGDRWSGLVSAHIDLVHAHGIYDLEVDTSVLSAMECAEQIKERLLNGAPPNAFQQLQASMAVSTSMASTISPNS